MTRVDFYVLAAGGVDAALHYSCRLSEKALRRGHRIYIHLADAEQVQALDELLWSFSADSFLPHARAGSDGADTAPVVLGNTENDAAGHSDVLINLSGETPAFFSHFRRVAEIVCQDPAWLRAARSRYKFYSDRGYPLAKHDIPR